MPVKFSEKLLPNSIDEASNITHHSSLITFTAALFCGIAQAKSPNIDQLALDGVKFTNL
tara:strand:+ start:512 stop:688 length:177 start_codon:yes stop_codon:yes gene_type:complete